MCCHSFFSSLISLFNTLQSSMQFHKENLRAFFYFFYYFFFLVWLIFFFFSPYLCQSALNKCQYFLLKCQWWIYVWGHSNTNNKLMSESEKYNLGIHVCIFLCNSHHWRPYLDLGDLIQLLWKMSSKHC